MLENSKAHSGFAVDDVQAARAFYEGTLGLRVSGDGENLSLHLARDRLANGLRYLKAEAERGGGDQR